MRCFQMRKKFVVISLLVMFIFLISCVPTKPLTDEELEAELAKLTPEERAQLLKDLDTKEGGAFAGQAIARKYGSSKIAYATRQQIKNFVLKTKPAKVTLEGIDGTWCFDSDGHLNIFSIQETKGYCQDSSGTYLTDSCVKDLQLYNERECVGVDAVGFPGKLEKVKCNPLGPNGHCYALKGCSDGACNPK